MKAADFVREMLQEGIRLRLDGGRLISEAPPSVLTPERVAEISERKADLIAFLERGGLGGPSSPLPIERLSRESSHLGIISLEPMGRGRFAIDEAPPGISMAAACLKYAMGFEPADATLVAVRRLSQLRENVRIWKSGEGLSEGESAALEAGKGYAIPCPE